MTLNDLIFNDCLLVGFSRDATSQSLALTFEAYDGNDASTEPDLYILECSGVDEVKLQFSPEFPSDLNRPYSHRGEDQRANEIHELRRDPSGHIHLLADMVQGSFYCKKFRLLRVVAAEAEA
jgi:hypothetical protein